jgi:hypothetical protein
VKKKQGEVGRVGREDQVNAIHRGEKVAKYQGGWIPLHAGYQLLTLLKL